MMRLEGSVEGLTAHEQEVLQRARVFSTDFVRPNARAWEVAGQVPAHAFELAAKEGLCLLFNQENSSANISYRAMARVAEELGAGCISVGLPLVVQNYISWAVELHPSVEVRQTLLNSMRQGRMLGGICLTEPAGGSDAAAMKTTAVRQPDGSWRISGEKAWVLSGTRAAFFIVFCRIQDGTKEEGIGAFLVRRDLPGIIIGSQYELMAGNALGCTSLVLDDVMLQSDDLLLEPGKGFRFGMQIINFARIYVAAMACGLLRSGLQEALDYTDKRQAFGKTILSFQGVQWQLSDVLTNLYAARSLVDEAIGHSENEEVFKIAVAHAKKYATNVAYEGLTTCMQLLGANGLLASHAVGRQLWSAAIAYYLDGTAEIQNILIGRSLLQQ